MATKSFKGFVPERGIEFELENPDGSRRLTIHCKAAVPGSKFLEFMAAAGSSGPGNEGMDFVAMAKTVREVFEVAITPDDLPMFWAFVDDPDNGIGLEQLSEIGGWLAQQFAGERPTTPSSA